MKRTYMIWAAVLGVMLGAPAGIQSQADFCLHMDEKPVLRLEQVTQEELIDYLIEILGLTPPSGPGLENPEERYLAKVQLLIDRGYLTIEPESQQLINKKKWDNIVTRHVFAEAMYDVAVATDPDFAAKYPQLPGTSPKIKALLEGGYLYAAEGPLYRDEIISVLCEKQPAPPEIVIQPEDIRDAQLEEVPRSPF